MEDNHTLNSKPQVGDDQEPREGGATAAAQERKAPAGCLPVVAGMVVTLVVIVVGLLLFTAWLNQPADDGSLPKESIRYCKMVSPADWPDFISDVFKAKR